MQSIECTVIAIDDDGNKTVLCPAGLCGAINRRLTGNGGQSGSQADNLRATACDAELDGLTAESPNNPHLAADPLLMYNGEFVHTVVDLRIPGRGLPFEFKRTYRSRLSYNGVLGGGWDHSYNRRLIVPADNPLASLPSKAASAS